MNVRWKIRLPLRGPVACALLLALLCPIAFAQTGPLTTQSLLFDQAAASHVGNYLGLQAGFIYTDNVFLERNGPGDELALLGLVGDAQREGPRLDYKLDSDISLIKYLHEDFPTQPFGYLDGLAEFKIVPGLFSWTARDTYNDLIISPYLPVTPDNLEAINYLTTGPRLMWQPTLRTSLVVNGEYSIIDSSSKSPLYVNIDNHRYGGDATISRAFSNTTSAYLSATAEKVQFSDTLVNTDFRQEGGAVGLKYSDLRTVADVSIGYEKLHTVNLVTVDSIIGVIERPQNATPSGTNWKVELSRLITPNQRVSLHARREITDAANLFRLGVDQPVPSTVGNQIVSGTPFTYTSYGASWRLAGSPHLVPAQRLRNHAALPEHAELQRDHQNSFSAGRAPDRPGAQLAARHGLRARSVHHFCQHDQCDHQCALADQSTRAPAPAVRVLGNIAARLQGQSGRSDRELRAHAAAERSAGR